MIDLLVDFRGHEPVKLRVFREPVLERHQCASHLDQTASGIYIFDKIHLLTGDIDKLRKFQPVCRCLIQHDQELRVGKHGPCCVGLQQILHVLRDAGTVCPVLSHTLPEREQEVRRILMLKEQVDLIDEDESLPALRPVFRDAVQDAVQHHQHADGHQLLSQIQDVVAYETVVCVHIGVLCKGIERTFREKLYRKCYLLRLRLIL